MILARVIGLPAVASLALGVVSWLIPKTWKGTLVSWRTGVSTPAIERSVHKNCPADLRIDMNARSARLGVLPTDYQTQSARWYATYRNHTKESAVTQMALISSTAR